VGRRVGGQKGWVAVVNAVFVNEQENRLANLSRQSADHQAK